MLDWESYTNIAERFQGKVQYQDREDIKQEILTRLAEAETKRNGEGALSQAAMLRLAKFTVADYWRSQWLPSDRLPCGRCSKVKRGECHEHDLYHECTKGMSILSLNYPIEDEEGHTTELWQTLADDTAIDLDAWMDAKLWALSCPIRLIEIAHKKAHGYKLTNGEKCYLSRYRRDNGKQLTFE